jgi:hypothetical protein
MALMASDADAPIGLVDLAVPVACIADDLLELESPSIFVVAQDFDNVSDGLEPQIEAVGEAVRAWPGPAITGDSHHQPRRGKVVGMS